MPIYTYECVKCGAIDDYLVAKPGQKPASCIECGGHKLERILAGQTFATVSATIGLTFDGQKMSNLGIENTMEPDQQHKPEPVNNRGILEPGVYLSAGVSEDGKELINVSRVQDDGNVDASVTGVRRVH
jgi:putative FmdB family regulatory protein